MGEDDGVADHYQPGAQIVRIEKIAYIVLADKLPRPRVGLRIVR